MDTENFTPNETRKTIRHFALWIMAILFLYKVLGWIDVYFQAA